MIVRKSKSAAGLFQSVSTILMEERRTIGRQGVDGSFRLDHHGPTFRGIP